MDKSRALVESRDRPTQFDRRKFADELTKLLTTPGYSTERDQSVVTPTQKKEPAMEPKEVTQEETVNALSALDALALELTDALGRSNTETFMLCAPMTLTVKRANAAYSKQAHVGGEDFSFVKAYRGKRSKLIFVFKPTMVSEYVEMEVEERIAMESLTGFKECVSERFGKLHERIAEVRALESATKEQEKLADRHEQYKAIGFGSW